MCLSLSVCLPACLSVCLPVSQSVCLSVSVCLSACLSVFLSVCLSACLLLVFVSHRHRDTQTVFCLPVCLCVFLSVCLCVCVSNTRSMSVYLSVWQCLTVCFRVVSCLNCIQDLRLSSIQDGMYGALSEPCLHQGAM